MGGLDVTTKIGCSIRCRFCPQYTLIQQYAKTSEVFYMSVDTFKTCIDKVPTDVSIWFAGMCEPWLNPHCTEMVLYAHEMGHEIHVSTTMVRMSVSDIDAIEHIPFKSFRVHVASGDEDLERIVVADEYLEKLARIKESRINTLFHHHGTRPHDKVMPLLDVVRHEISRTRASNEAEVRDLTVPKRKKGVIECSVGLRFNELLPNGDVYLCCNDYGLKHKIGNLLTGEYGSLFQSEEFRRIEKGLKDPSMDILCRYCNDAQPAGLLSKGLRQCGKLSYYTERGYAYLTREKLVFPA